MSDVDSRPWGMCAAYGCPLLGTMGEEVGGKWFCFCHVRRPHSLNDAITARLRKHEWLVNSTLDIRQFQGQEGWGSVLGGIEKLCRDHDRIDLMFGEADSSPRRPGRPIVNMWLQRLEGELITITAEAGMQAHIPTAPVTGPEYAAQPYTEPA